MHGGNHPISWRAYPSIVSAFAGPLSKIPGPFISKFTRLPWALELIAGKHTNTAEQLFQKYGDMVRVGKLVPTIYMRETQG
jgi:hypothetical protein